jgi:hypothetical protein
VRETQAVRLVVEGVRAQRALVDALRAEGVSVEESVPIEQRGAGRDIAEWVIPIILDEASGGRLSGGVRATVRRVVEEFKRRYPNITISIED